MISAKSEVILEWYKVGDMDYKVMKKLLDEDNESDILTKSICFHGQQCIEKYLKAYLTYYDVIFGKTHNLDKLIEMLKPYDAEIAKIDLEGISEYGVDVRYPFYDEPSVSRAKEVFATANTVIEYVAERIGELL